jgi:hypothetical protein
MWWKTSGVTRRSENSISGHGQITSLSLPSAPRPFELALINILLDYHFGNTSKLSWDVSYPPTTIMARGDVPSLMTEAATSRFFPKIILKCSDDLYFPYDISIFPGGKESSWPPQHISVQDVLYGLYKNLRTPLTPKEYSRLTSDGQKSYAAAYNTRVNRIVDPTKRETERRKGLKRIDHLIVAGRTHFIGLAATESNDIFIAHFAPYNPGWAHVYPIMV